MSLQTNSPETSGVPYQPRKIYPLTYGPCHNALINGSEGVREGLDVITRLMFAGTAYERYSPLNSAYALVDDGQGNIVLHGYHRFWRRSDLRTRHTLHTVDVREVVVGPDGDSVVAEDSLIDYRFVLESDAPHSYGTVVVLDEGMAAIMDALLDAAEQDAFYLAGASES